MRSEKQLNPSVYTATDCEVVASNGMHLSAVDFPSRLFIGLFIVCRSSVGRLSIRRLSIRRLIGAFLLLISVTACTTAPLRNMQTIARENDLRESVIPSREFEHRVFRNASPPLTDTLNVYFEGDGMPWMLRYVVTSDPTPRQPMMLKMMALDDSPAIYIGRPCYNGFSKAPKCRSNLWTSARYSAQVVNSMVEVLRAEISRRGVTRINLFGHSGGGTIAMLVAEQLPETMTIVTIAGNLDIDAWTKLHGYSPLYTSLNPARRPQLPEKITQVHLLGARDRNIPPEIVSQWISKQANSYGVTFENFGHSCCWSQHWRGLLKQIRAGSIPLHFSVKPFKRPKRDILFSLLSGGKENQ